MRENTGTFERRTTADVVFEQLHREIASLTLLPGTKLSEAEVARRFGVSRQPVREAFSRLGNLELLLVRPQKGNRRARLLVRTSGTRPIYSIGCGVRGDNTSLRRLGCSKRRGTSAKY